MTPEELFTAALGLRQRWRIVECRFEGEPKRLELRLEHVRGQQFECPQRGTLCGVHDTIERRWRHLNFFGVPLRVGGHCKVVTLPFKFDIRNCGRSGPEFDQC
jgi:hypothetical protein